MRAVASLFTLGLMMALFHRLASAAPLEARATLALGFLLLAAQLGGALAQRARLPRLTGFLVTGFAAGPAWLGLVRADELGALRFIADAAVSLVAFTAGTQLKLDTLRRGPERATLARASAATIVAPFLTVALVTFTVAPWFPLTIHQPVGDAITVALVLGVVAAASSPVVTMGLIDELGARGPLARTILGVTVVKDIAVFALFALVLVLGRFLASAGALDSSVAWDTLAELAGSLAAGVALGYVLARYLRVVRRDAALWLVAFAFVTAESARVLGLEPVLIALAAGGYVGNLSPAEADRLLTTLSRWSVPVYAVVFGLAGAELGAGAGKLAWWPWILLLVGLRALGLYYGVRWVGSVPGVTPVLARYGWLGLMSQGGVAVGVAAAARRAFPEWNVSLEALVVAMIGVHLVVGPVCLRRALRLAGEVTEGEHVTDGITAGEPGSVVGSGGVR